MNKNNLISAVLATAVTIIIGPCWSGSAQAGPWNDHALVAISNSDPTGQCTNLMGMQIPSQGIGLPTTGAVVTSTLFVKATNAGNANGEYCKVEGDIHPVDATAPNIHFRVDLPTNWNGKAVQFGGGGYNGVIPKIEGSTTLGSGAPPLTLGYMTFGGDSGHTAADSNDASFAMNDEALLNFGYMHIKKTRDAVFEIAKTRYGKTPKRLYFSGGSTGGREGLTAAIRWPDDYDGISTNYPTANFLGLRLWGVVLAHKIYDNNSAGWIPLQLTKNTAAYAISQCDVLDGVADGLVSNIKACCAQSSQVIAHFACPPGVTTNCLTPAMIASSVQAYHEGYTLPYALANGIMQYEGYNSLESVLMDVGTDPVLYNPVKDGPNAHHVARADQFVKYFVTRDPNFSLITLDAQNPGVWQARIVELSIAIDATNPDLRKFMKKGGKIIWLHGTEDASVSPFSNARYYESIVAQMGQANVDKFMRFYMVPGLAHGGGNFSPKWDNLNVLDNWVEKGIAPPVMPVASGKGNRTMPLCVYPTWAKYIGGDQNVAASFTCVNE